MTPHYLGPLDTRKVGPRRWLLLDALDFYSEKWDCVFRSPYSFQTDLASTPRISWVVFPPVDSYDPAAVTHDAAYADALTVDEVRVALTKRDADLLFREALGACGVTGVRQWAMYQAVRAFGDMDAHPQQLRTA